MRRVFWIRSKRNISNRQIDPKLVSSRAGEKMAGLFMLNPLIKENGRYYKITAFDLDISYERASAKSSTVKSLTDVKESVLNTGNWYKFKVDTSGVFKIDFEFLEEIGIDPESLLPNHIRIYGNGGHQLPQLNREFRYSDLEENAIYVHGQEDGSFDKDDYILFYAQGPHGWEFNLDNYDTSHHTTNIYSDYSYYFISTDKGPGKRVTSYQSPDQNADITVEQFDDYLVHEIEQNNLFSNGQQWLGEDFSILNQQNFNFRFSNLDLSEPLRFRARAIAVSFSPTVMNLKVNGKDLLVLNFKARTPGSYTLANSDEALATASISQEEININVDFNHMANPSSRAHLDYIEIFGKKHLRSQGGQFSFRNIKTNDPALLYEYRIKNADQIDQVWDVTDHLNPKLVVNIGSSNEFTFKSYGGGQIKEFAVLENDDFYIPQMVDHPVVENQNLHALKDIDYLLVTAKHLIPEAERLAEYHRKINKLKVEVVDVQKIYNEFGSGSPDITAIRDFVRYLYLNSSTYSSKIKYLCLFGDASFDFKDRINENNNIVPAFQSYESFNLVTSYVTDDYFGMMDEDEGLLTNSDLQDVVTGRYPVSTLHEAAESVDKTLSYYDASALGSWRNTITFVADDPDTPNEFILQQAVDLIAQEIEQKRPHFNLTKIYADAHQQISSAGGELYPSVNEAINNSVETGSLIVDYFGHGGVNGWAGERILEVPQIRAWNNPNQLPLFITVTCDFARFDNPLRPTAGEYTFWNPKGGASHMISTTREIFISIGQIFNEKLMENLLDFDRQNFSVAEALMHTKNDFDSSQRLFIYSFGDPAMKLARPEPDIKLTQLNGVSIEQSKDTLKALSPINMKGMVTNKNGQVLTDFNGILHVTIYDKPLDKTTLDNDNFGRKMNFTARESKVFSGRATVTEGLFSFDFIVPKDIRIAYGKAKISYYTENKIIDKTGTDQTIIIGGINPNAPEDKEGPVIRLFMNDESFVDGGNTNESPMLYAVLEDDSGINTSVTAVDHDIVAVLDDDINNPYILNDYYETDLDNFKKGKVKFPLRNLEPGLHTLKLKCWDTYNNPSESTLSFIVVNDNDLILSNVLNYPNPFVSYTEFWFNHNKPNEMLDVQVQIYTVSGKLVKTLNQSVKSDGQLSREINWNGLDDFGNKIGKGVYVYKLQVSSQLTNSRAEKFEKLVILQ